MRDLTQLLVSERMPPGVPMRFSLRDAPQRERAALYHEFFGRSVMRYDVEAAQGVPLDINVKMQELRGLLMVTGRMHGSLNRRTSACVTDGLDDYALAVNCGGKYVITQDGEEVALEHGEATLFSLDRTCGTMHWPPGFLLAMRFPRTEIAARVQGGEPKCLRRIPASTASLQLLSNYVHVAQDSHALASDELQRHFVEHIYDLLAVALGPTSDAAHAAQIGGLRAARLQAIKDDIARNLGDAGLSVAALAARHALTQRFVQRLFEAEGTTFTDYVLSQRLVRAHRRLSDPRRSGEKISTVALDCGFNDVSYFNRAFRRRYGMAPSDVRSQVQVG